MSIQIKKDGEKQNCPFCGSGRILEREGVIHEPYPDKELTVYRCMECGREFEEKEEE